VYIFFLTTNSHWKFIVFQNFHSQEKFVRRDSNSNWGKLENFPPFYTFSELSMSTEILVS
jgi:hypothetical protein